MLSTYVIEHLRSGIKIGLFQKLSSANFYIKKNILVKLSRQLQCATFKWKMNVDKSLNATTQLRFDFVNKVAFSPRQKRKMKNLDLFYLSKIQIWNNNFVISVCHFLSMFVISVIFANFCHFCHLDFCPFLWFLWFLWFCHFLSFGTWTRGQHWNLFSVLFKLYNFFDVPNLTQFVFWLKSQLD